MPLLKMDFISSVLALAEPVPFTVAILMTKSLMRALVGDMGSWQLAGLNDGTAAGPASAGRYAIFGFLASSACASSVACGQCTKDFCMSHAAVGQRSAQRPQ